MSNKNSFDLIVVGAGMAGVAAANKCADARWSVAIVDQFPYGGSCVLRGCDPKKILRRGAEIIDAVNLMQGKGIEAPNLAINWPDLMAHKRSYTDVKPAQIEGGLQKKGVTTLRGVARFTGETAMVVDGQQITARFFLIVTGSVPRPLNIPGAEHIIANDGFLELDELPARILFVGGGYVSFEFAHIAVRAGSAVTIIDSGDRPLRNFDPDLVEKVVARSESIGIDLDLDTTVNSVERNGAGFDVQADTPNGQKSWSVDLVVHGAGRIAALDQLDLGAANVKATGSGIVLNDYLQSVSNPAVYAAGDAAATEGTPLTPVAVFAGKVASSNMLKGNHAIPDHRGVPSAVFTVPELVRVGLLESEARDQGIDVEVRFTDTGGWYSNMRIGETCAAVKILIHKNTDRIVGAHMLGPEYAELVNILALGMRLELSTHQLKTLVATYPTVGSDLGHMF